MASAESRITRRVLEQLITLLRCQDILTDNDVESLMQTASNAAFFSQIPGKPKWENPTETKELSETLP